MAVRLNSCGETCPREVHRFPELWEPVRLRSGGRPRGMDANGGHLPSRLPRVERGEAGVRREIVLDEFIIMPNHFHAIVFLIERDDDFEGALRRHAPRAGLAFARESCHNPVGTITMICKGAAALRPDIRSECGECYDRPT